MFSLILIPSAHTRKLSIECGLTWNKEDSDSEIEAKESFEGDLPVSAK